MLKRSIIFITTLIMVITFSITPIYAYISPDFNLESEASAIYNIDTNTFVFSENGDVQLKPASLTKVMSALVILNSRLDYSEEVIITSEMLNGLKEADASIMGLVVGEIISIEDLLYGLLLSSGADAANALAINNSGRIDTFVNEMNRLGDKMGLKNTNFQNPTGLEDPSQYTSANDIAIMMAYAMHFDFFKEIASTDIHVTKPTNKHPNGLNLKSSNAIKSATNAYYSPYVIGGKTGFTYKAGRCFASFGEINNGANFVVVSLKAPITTIPSASKAFEDQVKIYEWLNANFKIANVVRKGVEIKKVPIIQAFKRSLKIKYGVDVNVLVDNTMNINDLKLEYRLLDKYEATIVEDQLIGYVNVYDPNDKLLGRFGVRAAETIKKNTFVMIVEDIFNFIITYWASIIFVFGALYLIILLTNLHLKKKRAKAKKQALIQRRLRELKRQQEKDQNKY